MKRISLFFLCIVATLLGLCPIAMAQSDDNDVSPSKRINEIKRDGGYIFSESTAKTQKEALTSAEDGLLIELSEYIASVNDNGAYKNIVLPELPTTPYMISMERGGDRIRVFLYLKKSDIDVNAIVTKYSKSSTDVAKDVNPVTPDKPAIEKNLSEETPKPAPAQVEQPVEISSNKELVYDDPLLTDWQKRLIKDLASKTKINEIRITLSKYKAQNKIKRMGSAAEKCNTPETAFYIIPDANGNVSAILSDVKPWGERINYLNGTETSITGNSYLWFTLAK